MSRVSIVPIEPVLSGAEEFVPFVGQSMMLTLLLEIGSPSVKVVKVVRSRLRTEEAAATEDGFMSDVLVLVFWARSYGGLMRWTEFRLNVSEHYETGGPYFIQKTDNAFTGPRCVDLELLAWPRCHDNCDPLISSRNRDKARFTKGLR